MPIKMCKHLKDMNNIEDCYCVYIQSRKECVDICEDCYMQIRDFVEPTTQFMTDYEVVDLVVDEGVPDEDKDHYITVDGYTLCRSYGKIEAGSVSCSVGNWEKALKAKKKLIKRNPDRDPDTIKIVEGMCPSYAQDQLDEEERYKDMQKDYGYVPPEVKSNPYINYVEKYDKNVVYACEGHRLNVIHRVLHRLYSEKTFEIDEMRELAKHLECALDNFWEDDVIDDGCF